MLNDALKLIMIPVVVIAVMLGFMMCMGSGVATIIFSSFLFIVIAFGCAMPAIAGTTGRRVWTLMNALEQTVRLNLPLPRMLRAMSDSGDLASDRMLLAAESLERGEPLAVALDAVPWMPVRIMRLLAAAEHTGRLPQVLGRLVAQHRAALARNNPPRLFYRIYPLLLGIVYIGVGGMFFVFVVPKFEQIFADFGTELPAATVAMLSVARSSGPLLVLLALALIVGLIWTIESAGRWKLVSGLIEGPGGWIANRLPWIGRIRMHQALGDVLDFAADGIEAGRPFDLALAEAAQITTNSALRARVMHWIDAITDGESIPDAARVAGMPALVCGMLSTGLQTPDVAPVFRFLGRYYANRFSRAMALLDASVLPVLAIAMGSLVLWFMLSVLLPLTTLIDATSPYHIGL